jgi:hypothetical protein
LKATTDPFSGLQAHPFGAAPSTPASKPVAAHIASANTSAGGGG